jgi:uncharacterized membrane protein
VGVSRLLPGERGYRVQERLNVGRESGAGWFGTARQLGESEFAATPAAAYGIVLLAAGLAYFALQTAIIHLQGETSTLALAIGRDLKGKVSAVLYALGIGLAFVNRWVSLAIYVVAALLWLIPDRRLERTLADAPRR